MTTIFIVDDHPVIVAGLRSLLEEIDEVNVAGSCGNAIDALPFLKKNPVDLVLMDINLPDISGIELCKKVKKEFPALKVIAISTFSDRGYITRMIDNGASGYLIKSASAEEIKEAIHTVMSGRLYLSLSMEQLLLHPNAAAPGMIPVLTRREKEVLGLIAAGLTNNQIADQLYISPLTVDSHRKNLLTKFGVNNTAMLIRFAVENKLV
ncbi:response regulator transcription factor [Niabella soli]|uniref:LuxR family transcriptional regulator n=1 Tax=Niabella soli DSM 19437 TaxID=929713 RepID=W0EU47_9BACT|nr:response regulator transcription factor [Niabella soli]AHF14340.1 LuxR family transcriptional regulator [Niabella soli DSM 19437]